MEPADFNHKIMHDLHLSYDIAQVIIKHAKKYRLKKISRVLIELGELKEHNEIINSVNLVYNLKKILEKELLIETRAIKIIKQDIDGWRLCEIDGE